MNYTRKKLDSILVKPAGPDCNLFCTYCFYLEKSSLYPDAKTHRMSEEVLKEMVKQVMAQEKPQISFGWQGGEPTLMGLSFFEKAVEFEKHYGRGHSVGNGLQTNGILIDAAWAKFLKEYRFLVGLSLDGPEHVHDHYRFLRNGKGTWSLVVDKAKLLLDSDVEVNALTVLNDYSIQFPEEIYDSHKSLGLNYMQFIPCVETDPKDPTRAASFSVPARKYGEFLCKLFDMWRADFKEGTPTTSVRFFDSVFFSYAGFSPPECTLLGECGVYVVVEHNGDIYSCDFFVEPEWRLGNVMENDLVHMLNSQKQKKFGRMKAELPDECRKCTWLHHCRGGCTKDRIRDSQDQGLSHLCQSYKMFFEHADSRLRRMAEDWKHKQTLESPQQFIEGGRNHEAQRKTGRNNPCPCGSGLKYKKCCGKTP